MDESSGYRYYDELNYELTKSIKILKEYDFSLAEIKEILAESENESDILGFLQHKLRSVQDKIDRYSEISRSLELTIQVEIYSAIHFCFTSKISFFLLLSSSILKFCSSNYY